VRVKPVCYSSSLGYVFIHTPKCAGTSIHRALRTIHDRLSLPLDERKYHKHEKASEVRRILGPTWDKCFTFSFIRNPWDLMVSSYHWWLNHASQFPSLVEHASKVKALPDFGAFIRSPYGSEMINEQQGKDLTDWISDGDKVIVDLVGRYENLEQDWQRVCEALKIESLPLTRENRVARSDYRSFYDVASQRLVADRFARTIKQFGYEF
jgi:hypothetical protein